MARFKNRMLSSGIAACSLLAAHPSMALDGDQLFDLSLEELMNIEVTIAARKAQRVADTASAVFVITADDIRRLGIRSIPEALRLAPGITVHQIDSSSWSVGTRGLGGRFANKLLVLQDGRPLYTPTFSGVEWDAQMTHMEQIDRIEVVRGPGSAVWGTNAVAGVINIITRDAQPERGTSFSAGSDLAGGSHVSLATDRRLGDAAAGRAFLHVEAPRELHVVGPGESNDDWYHARGGVRVDAERGAFEHTFTAEAYRARIGRNFAPSLAALPIAHPDRLEGALLIARSRRTDERWGTSDVQASIDYIDRDSTVYEEERFALNLDARHAWQLGGHDLVAGVLYRRNEYDLTQSVVAEAEGIGAADHVVSAFIQDELQLVPDRLALTFGLRVENNDLSDEDYEWMPSVRALYKPLDDHTVWAAFSRAVRTPSVGESQFSLNQEVNFGFQRGLAEQFPIPLRTRLIPSPDFGSEIVDAFEIGARGQLGERIGYDLTLFAMRYEDMRSVTPVGVVCEPSETQLAVDPSCLFASTNVRVDLAYSNQGDAAIDGAELAVDVQLRSDLLLRGSYTYIEADFEAQEPAQNGEGALASPERFASAVLSWRPSDRLESSFWLRYTGAHPLGRDDDSWQAQANVAWRPSDTLELSLTGRNLFHSRRMEAVSELGDLAPTGVSRMVYVQARLTF